MNALQSQQIDLARAVDKLKEDFASLKHDLVLAQKQQPNNAKHSDFNLWPTNLLSSKENKKQLLAAVHANLEDSRRRQCNTVVSGLKPVPVVGNVDLFLNICECILSLKPYVVRNKSRRLGRQQTNKVQPLLICLETEETAKQLLAAAKQLRRSDDVEVRNHIYLNPDLTPGEALAAYDRRQQRRRRQRQLSTTVSIVDAATILPV